MISPSNKSKQYLLVALKVLILGAAFMFIYFKISTTDATVIKTINESFDKSGGLLLWFAMLVTVLVTGNWALEILKWKIAVSYLQPISFLRALKESLTALTVSIITPNRIGDYGAKASFYKSRHRKQILLINFMVSGAQMLITCFFGVIGLVLMLLEHEIVLQTLTLFFSSVALLLFVVLAYLFKERELLIKGFSLSNVWRFYRKVGVVIIAKVLLLSLLRYVLFSYLFYVLLIFFGAQISLANASILIFSMYLLVSIIPSIIVFDVVIRGGIAVWLFSLANVPELVVLATVLSMWLLNTVFPACCGSYFLARYKPQTI